MTSGASNSDETKRALKQLRRDPSDDGQLGAYASDDGSGAPRVIPGDEDAPYVKHPPFAEDVQLWLAPTLLPVDAYLPTEPVDVQAFRLIKVYFEMVWEGDDDPTEAQLSIIPEGLAPSQFTGNLEWYTLGVVDATVSYLTPTGEGDGFGSRTWAPSELRTRLLTNAGGVDVNRFFRSVLTFDVADATSFRIRALQNVVAQELSRLALAYQRSN